MRYWVLFSAALQAVKSFFVEKSHLYYVCARLMRNVIVISLVIAFLIQSFSKLTVALGYELNKEYIAQSLCENRANLSLNCNGKCHLKKSMKDDDGNQNMPSKQFKEFEILLFLEASTSIISLPQFETLKHIDLYIFKQYASEGKSIHHPPKA